MNWFSFDPGDGIVDLEFGEFLITIEGTGLLAVFEAVKARRLAWVRELGNEIKGDEKVIVSVIRINPPSTESGIGSDGGRSATAGEQLEEIAITNVRTLLKALSAQEFSSERWPPLPNAG